MFLQLPLLLGLLALGPRVCGLKFEDISKSMPYFGLCVEFAVFHFNQQEPDEYAYKLLWVGRSQREKYSWIYLMDLDLGRTICKKHDEDTDNCPLQEGPEAKKVSCTFIVDSRPWFTQFTLLNSTCQQTWEKELTTPTAVPFPLEHEGLES
ncbi:probable cystatin-15 [Hippopotamus amphibius kiboko]|uniref:probable cystatin-15 n=1 Tax=Hippopotamus amphibius kiboko TaxID=575201 RepID=UPI002599321A|nr:probable cystatin-15 [Hippopotamus amphibius kiboko]